MVQKEAVVLWDHPEAEHSTWLASGCGTGTFTEHQARLRELALMAQDGGRRLVVVKASVTHVLSEVDRLGLPRSPESCEQALRRIYLRD